MYSVVCDPLLARLDFTVDGRHVPLRVTCFNHTRPQQHAPSHDIVVPPISGPNGVEAWHGVKLSAGRHILRWTFNRLRNTPHHRRKGITGRHGVGNGSGAHHHVDELDRGPGDDHEAMHAGLAGGATADIRQMDAAETNFVRIQNLSASSNHQFNGVKGDLFRLSCNGWSGCLRWTHRKSYAQIRLR